MRVANSRAGLRDQLDRFRCVHSPALFQQGLQVVARHVFHDDKKPVGIKSEIVHGDDVWMRQVGSGFGLLVKTRAKLRVAREVLA